MRTKRFERHVMAIAVLAAASSLSQAMPASAKSKTKATSRQSVGGPTREACDNAMSFMSYNVTADNTCPQSLAVPDYSHAVKVCTSAFGEKSVTAAALRGVKEFKSNLEQEGRDDLCPKLQTFLQQYTPPAWTKGDQRDASAERPTEEQCKEVLVTYASIRKASTNCSGFIDPQWQRKFAAEQEGANKSIRDCTESFGEAFVSAQLERGERGFLVFVEKKGREAACRSAAEVIE